MAYRFAVRRESYEDLASGRVLRSAPGHTGFPVRLAREMFEQCLEFHGSPRRCTVYDPCCGTAHLATTLGLLYGDQIALLNVSDVRESALGLARGNLALVTRVGLDARVVALGAEYAKHGNPAHAAAEVSARSLRARMADSAPQTRCFLADARDEADLLVGLGHVRPEIIVSDIPYGRGSTWLDRQGRQIQGSDALYPFLEALASATTEDSIVALATARGQKVVHPSYERKRQFKIGKRRVTWLARRGDQPDLTAKTETYAG